MRALDYPGAAQFGGTSANGINNEGVVTGYYHSDSKHRDGLWANPGR